MAVELFEAGVELMAQNLKRRHPLASEEELRGLLQQWLVERPGAEFGDGYGTPVDLWERRRASE